MIQDLLQNFEPQLYIGWLFLFAAVVAAITGVITFPAIKNVAEAKNLMDTPEERSVHHVRVPNLGGVGIYLSIVVAITMIGGVLDTKSLFLILGGITILFFLGLKDDILVLSPRKKFIGQLLAAVLLIIFTDTRIMGLHGLFGVTIMPYALSVVFTLFVYVLVINAFNLIDGIDGLAGSLALMAVIAFAWLFSYHDNVSMVVLGGAVCGAIIPFLFLNFSRRKKMFLGDTGSMILGFILAVMAVRFINASEQGASLFYNSSPIFVLGILFFPLLDTMRIFIIRIFVHKKSPFIADKNHIHHRFLEMGFSHKSTTAMIVGLNILLVASVWYGRSLDIHWQLLLLIGFGSFLYTAPFVIVEFKRKGIAAFQNFL
ncbi:undecaprenyl/decaprenyl-phosphate alpha-N-acetylglucosaminyl 1-phosphate transferase [Paucihalobacter ruber]|uniref:Undecaprenyl/decaprenyl-phosphate alpha-N-acetylglucosaminyl 1-phosphate transferase n=1 Tax=Paucihalobacter ruber TaxID=2567861 RepID=A0A506PPD0_9FLAO|nr:MraY family glycosyltransferase [Paucihalobacter ruber]TPV35733.1 undecaprenyl/decaprenyl-phosphate alpha-N-acetylglucosaminyl 1-phosphate transferase [Paucihalobacter ruber]